MSNLVANRCNEELIAKATEEIKDDASYYDNFKAWIKAALTPVAHQSSVYLTL